MTGIYLKNRSLKQTHPDLASQWHPTKNGNLKPSDITSGSNKKVWWKCEVTADHEWEASPNSRMSHHVQTGCPCCSGKKVVTSNCLATTDPELAKQWHPTKNKNITPESIMSGSNKKVWWKCNAASDHEWEASPNSRNKNGCPCCYGRKAVVSNCLHTLHPEIAKQWHPVKNGKLTAFDVTPASMKKVWWQCPKVSDHEWQSTVADRIYKRTICSCCHGITVVGSNCLATLRPDWAAQWHPTLNGNLTPFDVTLGSTKQVWWKCDVAEDHVWQTAPNSRAECPCCSHHKLVRSNCLAVVFPELAKQWHPKNKISPFEVVSHSHKKYWWKCDKADDHEWKTAINTRLTNGCPCCSGKKVVISNSLLTTHPDLVKEWHPDNKLLPIQVSAGSVRRILWQCRFNKKHEWLAKVHHRTTSKSGCPHCKSSIKEKLITAILRNKGIKFEREWRTDCRSKNTLPFDFAIFQDSRVIGLIEYQGIQHFKPIDFAGRGIAWAKESFISLQERDRIKRNYCFNNHIPLLEIPYTQEPEAKVLAFIKNIIKENL